MCGGKHHQRVCRSGRAAFRGERNGPRGFMAFSEGEAEEGREDVFVEEDAAYFAANDDLDDGEGEIDV